MEIMWEPCILTQKRKIMKAEQLKDAEKDLKKKVDEILKDNMKYMKSRLKKYLKENTYAQEQHLKEDLGWSIPKDFVVALFEDAAEQYSCLGCSEPVKRKAKKNTRIIKSKLYVW